MEVNRGWLWITAAAVLWGTLGPTFKGLNAVGVSPGEIAFWRALLAGGALLAWLLLRAPSRLRLAGRDVPLFVAYGLVSVAIFFVVYPAAVQRASVAVAAVLLYTAPAWVALLAALLFGEPLSRRKLLALAVTFAGAALVAGVADPAALRANGWGVALGLASGFTYATYSLFGKAALRRYAPTVATFYALLFGALFLVPTVWGEGAALLAPWGSGRGAALLLYVGLVPTAGSFLLYTTGLRQLGDAGRASIIATIEPLVAALLGYVLLGEALAPPQWLGGALILAGVLALSR